MRAHRMSEYGTMCVFCASIRCAFEAAQQTTGPEEAISYSSSNSAIPTIEDARTLQLTETWSVSSLTYGFPTSGAAYDPSDTLYDEEQEFLSLSAGGEAMVRSAIGNWAKSLPLSFTELTGDAAAQAQIRIAGSSVVSTAWAYPPGASNGEAAGDIWVGVDKNYNALFSRGSELFVGSYEYYVAMHELGHSLGLKHPHDPYGDATDIMSRDFDALEYTIMSYRGYVGGGVGSLGVQRGHFPQTPMMLDIAALQDIYGADFTRLAGDTVYRFDPDLGRMWIDGLATPKAMKNVIFRTLWDGDGTDLIDLSAYQTDVSADLNPGAGIRFDSTDNAQLSLLYNGGAGPIYASYNLYMSLLHNGDTRSLIENITTGSGDDVITGNQADNVITAGSGQNMITGGAGLDTVVIAAADGEISLQLMAGGNLRLTHGSSSTELSEMEQLQTQDGLYQLATLRAALPAAATGPTALSDLLDGGGGDGSGDGGGVGDGGDDGDGDVPPPPALELLINETSYAISGYGSQDEGSYSLSADGRSVTLSGNAWKTVALDQTIAADTVLSFTYETLTEGEIQGIGFVKNNALNQDYIFQLDGSQTYGRQTFVGQQEGASGAVSYDIQVGSYFTGDFDQIVFIGDDDANAVGRGTFADISLTQAPAPAPVEGFVINGSDYAVETEGFGGQAAGPAAQLSTDGKSMTLLGNVWATVDLAVTVTTETAISFDFSAQSGAEIYGIGFARNDKLDADTIFQLDGSQTFGIQDYNGTSPDGAYVIQVGEHFTGSYDQIVFIADDDANGASDVTYSDFLIL